MLRCAAFILRRKNQETSFSLRGTNLFHIHIIFIHHLCCLLYIFFFYTVLTFFFHVSDDDMLYCGLFGLQSPFLYILQYINVFCVFQQLTQIVSMFLICHTLHILQIRRDLRQVCTAADQSFQRTTEPKQMTLLPI